MRIIAVLTGQTLSPAQISERMPDIPQATLYRHIKKLEQGEVLQIAERRPVRGVDERFFTLVPESARFSREEFATIPPEDHERYFAILTGAMNGALSRYVRQADYDTTQDGMTYFQAVLNLTDEQAQQFRLDLIGLIERAARDGGGPGSRKRVIGAAVIPE